VRAREPNSAGEGPLLCCRHVERFSPGFQQGVTVPIRLGLRQRSPPSPIEIGPGMALSRNNPLVLTSPFEASGGPGSGTFSLLLPPFTMHPPVVLALPSLDKPFTESPFLKVGFGPNDMSSLCVRSNVVNRHEYSPRFPPQCLSDISKDCSLFSFLRFLSGGFLPTAGFAGDEACSLFRFRRDP